MSRLAKKPIAIPPKASVEVLGHSVTAKGPAGEVRRSFRPEIAITVEGEQVILTPTSNTVLARALWGTYAAHLRNMLQGVMTPFQKQLILEGVGYKADVSGDTVQMSLGFSHPVKVKVPQGLTVKAEKNTLTISGVDLEQVGQFAASIRALKKPEPYKGKGFRYSTEVIRRKQGKKTA